MSMVIENYFDRNWALIEKATLAETGDTREQPAGAAGETLTGRPARAAALHSSKHRPAWATRAPRSVVLSLT